MEQVNNWAVAEYDEVSSTNDTARELTLNPPHPHFVVTARRQTAGRGRRGRSWSSLDGNLFMSQCFPLEMKYLTDAVFLVSLSMLEAVLSFSPRGRAQLKWPNDVLIENHKISGILLEKGENGYIIAGIGVNIKAAPPADASRIYPAACLSDYGISANCREFLAAYLQAFDNNFALWREQGFMPVKDKWLSHVKGLHEEIVVNMENEQQTGIFEGISDNGALQLRQGDKIRPILAGDIFYKEEKKINE